MAACRSFPPPPPPRTDWTRLVPPPVLTGHVQELTGSTATTFQPALCVPGATYTFKVQALYGASGSILSKPSFPVSVPVTAPARMSAPTLSVGPDPATSILVSWTASPVVSMSANAAIQLYKVVVASVLSPSTLRLEIPGEDTSLVVPGLGKDTQYLVRIQAVNGLGESPESLSALVRTEATDPARVENFTADAASESATGEAIDLHWSVPDSGGSGNVDEYRIFPYAVGRDYDEGVVVPGTTGVSPTSMFRLTGLSGGIDYNFVIRAYKNGRVSERSAHVPYRTVSVAPRQIRSLDVTPATDPDRGYTYNVRLSWDLPIDAETTGGDAITGFVLQYARLDGCDSCADASTACVSRRSQIPWESTGIGVGGVLGEVTSQELALLKGSTYIFRIRAINVIGPGAWWPSACSVTDAACFGGRVGSQPFACHDPIVTAPTAIDGFGDWSEGTPGVAPTTETSVSIVWTGHDYNNQSINGGLPIQQIEIQRALKSNPRWPLDHYCPTLPEPEEEGGQPVCLYQKGCNPPCVATCPQCFSSIFGEGVFNAKVATDFDFLPADPETYVYRVRYSNEFGTCADKPMSEASSFSCVWGEFSALAEVKVMQPLEFSNIKVRVVSETSIEVLWYAPSSNAVSQADVGDKANIYYGPSSASVGSSPYTGATVVFGPDSFEAGGNKYNKYAVSGLVPATTYYFSVVGYYEGGATEIQSTRSEVSKAISTPVGRPAQVVNVTAASPPELEDQLTGSILVQWGVLAFACGTGSPPPSY